MSEMNVGQIGLTPITWTDYVGTVRNGDDIFSDGPEDIYKFSIDNQGRNINLTLRDIASGKNATLQLYRDVNGNGRWDATDQAQGLLASSGNPGNSDESISYRGAAAGGTYFARVYNYGSGTTYHLDLSGTLSNGSSYDRASNLLPKEVAVGRLVSDRSFNSSVNDTNTTNTYAFSVSAPLFQRTKVDFILNGLSNNADMRLVRDSNNNRIVDRGEVIASSMAGGISAEKISASLSSGNYYLQVYQFSGNTNYNLTMDHKGTSFS